MEDKQPSEEKQLQTGNEGKWTFYWFVIKISGRLCVCQMQQTEKNFSKIRTWFIYKAMMTSSYRIESNRV